MMHLAEAVNGMVSLDASSMETGEKIMALLLMKHAVHVSKVYSSFVSKFNDAKIESAKSLIFCVW